MLRILLWTLLALMLASGIAGYALYRSASTPPSWYAQPDPAAASQPAREAENKLIEIQSWAGARYAWDYAHATGRRPLVHEPDARLTLTLVDDEVNALLQKWFVIYGQERIGGPGHQRVGDVINAPMVHFTPEGVTLAATVVERNWRVVSAEIRPAVLPDGQLSLQLVAVRAGRLRLPEFVWSDVRRQAVEAMEHGLPGSARAAALDRGGGANGELVSAVSMKQGIDSLRRSPTINAMFLPILSEGNALPVRIESVELGEGTLTLTVQSITPEQRRKLLDAAGK